jgi:hypothetical protein
VRTKTLKQTITFKASPRQVYDMIMDSKKHQSLSGEKAKISQRVGGKFTRLGFAPFGYQSGAKAWKENCSSVACDRVVAGSLLDCNF